MCPVCKHHQEEEITRAIVAGIDTSVIAVRHRVRKALLERHAAHMMPVFRVGEGTNECEARNHLNGDCSDVVVCVEHEPETAQDALKLALPHVRQAVRLAGADQDEQQRIVAILNRALEDEQMGLP